MDIRNPFGLRNGKIVMIEDISIEERGLQCNCVCPNCKEPLIARLGEINRHHFAHSGKGCDEVNAYLTGMYMVLNEHLFNKHPIYLPPVIARFNLSAWTYITEKTIENNVDLLSASVNDSNEEVACKGVEQAVFDNTEIVFSSSGKPEAIVVYRGTHSMAIRILPPSSVCKQANTSRYKDLATLEINLSGCEDFLQESSKSKIFSYIEKSRTICKWIYNPFIKRAFPNILERSKKYYEVAQEKMKKEEERQSILKNREIHFKAPSYIRSETKPRVDDRRGYEEVKDRFTQQDEQIRDSYGNRWIQCEECGKIERESYFAYYGGENHVNLGICKDCSGWRKK